MGRFQGDLLQRSFEFAVRVVKLVEGLPSNTNGWVIGRQLIRCGTAIGAIVREANHGLTDADFAYQCNAARKEAAETVYWLELCERTELLPRASSEAARQEAEELARILATIVTRTQARQKKASDPC